MYEMRCYTTLWQIKIQKCAHEASICDSGTHFSSLLLIGQANRISWNGDVFGNYSEKVGCPLSGNAHWIIYVFMVQLNDAMLSVLCSSNASTNLTREWQYIYTINGEHDAVFIRFVQD